MFYNIYGAYTIFKRETRRYLKVYVQTIIAPLLSNLLFLSVFGALFRDREIDIPGITYLSFLVPGLIAMGAIMNAIQNPSSSIIQQKYQNLLQDLNTFPVTDLEKVIAFVSSGTIRGVIIGLLTYVATIPFIGWQIASPIFFMVVLIIISIIFSSIGVIIGLLWDSFDQISFIYSIVLTPLVYFGGVFFRISSLPSILPNIAVFNPIFPMVDTLRFSFLGVHDGNIVVNMLFMLVILIASVLIALWMFKKGIGLKE